jgi:putative membrane protein
LRQHPTALFFNVARAMRALLFPIIAGILTARGLFLFFFFGLLLLGAIGSALLRYWRYRYRFAEQELVVEQGWIYRNVRHISYVRIQNINITRNLFHRLFGVSGMQLESASGSEPEAVMESLSPAAIDELHERVRQAKQRVVEAPGAVVEGAGEAQPSTALPLPRRQILRLGLGELTRHGLVSNRGMVLVGAALAFLFQGPMADRYLPDFFRWAARLTERLPLELVEALGPVVWLLGALMGFAVIMGVLSLLSVIYAIVRFYRFTLSVDPESVRAEHGLFTRVAITVPRRRVQLVGYRANPFHRLLGRSSIRIETAGQSGGNETASSLRWLAPILPAGDAARVLREVQPEVDWEAFQWRPLHPRARARILRVRLILLGAATALLFIPMGVTALAALLLVPLVFAYARGYARYAGWAVTPTAIAYRSGWLVQQQSIVRFIKIQTVSVTRNPFDRRWGMATVNVDTAGADPGGHGIRIRFIDYEIACELRDLLEEKMSETNFIW